EAFGLPLERVSFVLGDSTLPVAPIEGGSSHVATVGSAVAGACEKLQRKLLRLARRRDPGTFARVRFADVGFGEGRLWLRDDPGVAVELSELVAAQAGEGVEESYLLLPNLLRQRKYVRATHSA